MKRLIYDVAVSLDGFICGKDQSIEGFLPDGDHVVDYVERLKRYGIVIMGKNTYEFGFRYGLKPGEKAYPHMEHYIFSKTLKLDSSASVNVVNESFLEKVKEIKLSAKSNIYLCGGGIFAGYLLNNSMIDQIILKINPIILGQGIRLFENLSVTPKLSEYERKIYSNGVHLRSFYVAG